MISRRVFVRNGGLALVSLGFAPSFLARTVDAATGARRKVLVAIFQRGAVDGLNMIVPFGDSHSFFRLSSSTRASSGVMVAHLTPTSYSLIAFAASTVIWSSVASRLSMPRS